MKADPVYEPKRWGAFAKGLRPEDVRHTDMRKSDSLLPF